MKGSWNGNQTDRRSAWMCATSYVPRQQIFRHSPGKEIKQRTGTAWNKLTSLADNFQKRRRPGSLRNPGPAIRCRNVVAEKVRCFKLITRMYKVVQIWPGQTVTCLHTNSPGHIWTTLYNRDGVFTARYELNTLKNSTFFPHSVFMCFVWISK